MKYLNFVLVFALIFALSSCNDKVEEEIIWVNGYKVPCYEGGQQTCLEISDDDEPGDWEVYSGTINDFPFKEGVIQQVKVREIENEDTDGPENFYEMIEVISEREDFRKALNREWTLELLNDENVVVTDGEKAPTITFNINEQKINGFAGCNTFFAHISSLNENNIDFDDAGVTKMMCPDMDIENTFLELLDEADNYTVEKGKLILKDDDDIIAVFK